MWRISDFSTYVMWRHLKFPHNCHTWKAESISTWQFFPPEYNLWYSWQIWALPKVQLVFSMEILAGVKRQTSRAAYNGPKQQCFTLYVQTSDHHITTFINYLVDHPDQPDHSSHLIWPRSTWLPWPHWPLTIDHWPWTLNTLNEWPEEYQEVRFRICIVYLV